MLHIIRRAANILKKDGAAAFAKKFSEYASSYAGYKLFPQSNPKNANWHRYIRELDARAEILTCSPWKISLESTSVCNMQCIMCTHVFMPPRQGRHFNCEALRRLENYIAAAGEFQLMGHGEPLISPAFWQIMGYIKQHHKIAPRISISSNGAALTAHCARKLLDSPLQEISFSLDAAHPETYRKIRNSDFTRTTANIGHFLQLRRERGQTHPFVMLNMTLMRENIDELKDFITLAHSLGADAVQFWPLHDYDSTQTAPWTVERNGWLFNYREQMLGHSEEDAARANALCDQAVALANELGLEIIWPVGGRFHISALPFTSAQRGSGDDGNFINPGGDKTDNAAHGVRPCLRECVAPWEWMAITETGEVRPCCYVEQSFGNVRQTSPEEIWNGPDYREMRRNLAREVLPEVCRNAACKFARGAWMYK